MSQSPHFNNAMEVRQALWTLQKEILASLKAEFDRENGYEAAPTEWFQALMGAERYSWLRELTSLMADIDTMTELEFITDQHVSVARSEIERLLFNHEAHDNFSRRYHHLLKHAGPVMPLHSDLKVKLHNLPSMAIHQDQAAAERRNWQEEHRHQARKKRN